MKSLKFQLSAVALAVMLTACSNDEAQDTSSAAESTKVEQVATDANSSKDVADVSEAEKADAIYKEYWEESLKMNPISATFMGDDRYNDQLGDFGSEKGRAEALAFSKKYLKKISFSNYLL